MTGVHGISDADISVRPSHSRGDSRLKSFVEDIDNQDAASRYREEEADNGVLASTPDHLSSSSIEGETLIVAWEENDPENPHNFSRGRKWYILCVTMVTVINSTMGSALPSNAIPYITAEFGIEGQQQKVLPISMYLLGYIMGPLIWAPLSEQYGRRWLHVGTCAMYMVFTMACALSPNWPAFLIFRLFCGIFASAPIAVVTGVYADVYSDPTARGRAMGIFMVTTLFGPLLAPIISGFCAPTIGWRWTFWIGLIYAAVTFVPLNFVPETYGPVLLARRARRLRQENPGKADKIAAPHELERADLKQLATVVLTRPLRMFAFEPIVSCSCVYLALCYSIFYMSFQAYPIIFQNLYGLSPGVCGLTYLFIGLGGILALPIFYWYDAYLRKAQLRNAAWTHQEEYRRLPLAFFGGPMFVVSLFWLGWSAREGVPFVVPMLAGIPFGMGFMCIFQALLNYLTDAYEIFAASANAAASCFRSTVACVLPLATVPMFSRLGIAGACSLLGGLSALMCVVPFVFIAQGERIRAGSRFCTALRERKAEMARRVEEQRRRRAAGGGVFLGSEEKVVATDGVVLARSKEEAV